MKTILFYLFVLISLVVNSQNINVERKPTYFGLEISEQDVLDSLKIPYVSIQERNGVNGYGEKIEVDERKISEFNKFFNKNNEGFVFTPNENTPSIKFNLFFKYYKFLTEYDNLYISILENFNFDIIGYYTIELKESNGNYKTVQIVEYRYNKTNGYGTMVLLGDEKNTMKIVI
jgi:hypothetical protein